MRTPKCEIEPNGARRKVPESAMRTPKCEIEPNGARRRMLEVARQSIQIERDAIVPFEDLLNDAIRVQRDRTAFYVDGDLRREGGGVKTIVAACDVARSPSEVYSITCGPGAVARSYTLELAE
jgi:hypothetical protein